jgi:hypothetical protein
MRSRTVHLPAGPCSPEELCAAADELGRAPDFALAFLPPGAAAVSALAAMTAAWPGSIRCGCEAVTQFAGAEMTTSGSVQLFWLDTPAHRVAVEVVEGSTETPPPPGRIAAVARRIAAADGAMLLVDGLRFPAEPFLAALRRSLAAAGACAPLVAGGLASQRDRGAEEGAHVFFGDQILPAACLVVTLHGIHVQVEVVRGWDPASPIYTVTRAAGNVIYEIDGEPATEWYGRFFTTAEGLAPMPDAAYRFPLILEGPDPDRQGLYRSMRFFDQPAGAVTFWGSVQTGDRVRLGMGNDVSLVRTAAELPLGAPEAAILYSCVCRERVLGDMPGQEAATIHQALAGVALSGFFTLGEIGPTPQGGLAFYNHTTMLVLLTEDPA